MRTNLTFMTTTTEQSVLANGIIPLTTIQHKYQNITMPANNGVLLNKPGYYKVDGSFTVTAPVAGDVTISLRKNGINIPGITSTETITTATTETRTLNFTGIVKVICCEAPVALGIVNEGVAITLENAAFSVEYLD